MKILLRIALLFGLCTVLFLPACKRDAEPVNPVKNYDGSVYFQWNEKFLEIDRYAGGYRPGPGPRALAYLGFSAYHSVIAGMPDYNSLGGLYAGLNLPVAEAGVEYYWPACVNESYAYLMKHFFYAVDTDRPQLYGSIELLRRQLHDEYAGKTTPEILERSENFGRKVAEAVYEWEKADVMGHDAFLTPQPANYVPPVAEGLWEPTWPDYSPAMFPYWGAVRRFAMGEADLIARPPLPYSEDEGSLFYNQALETYNTVNNVVNNGPGAYDARWRAEFWSDDLLGLTFGPPSRLLAVADQVAQNEGSNLEDCALLFAQLGMALSDAGVALWNSKYLYNVERPITYIRRVVSKKYPEAADWKPILNNPLTGQKGLTPAFPAYPSGHSGFGGAGGKILSSIYEYTPNHAGTYTFTDLCHKDRVEFIGTPRTFDSFKDLANEDAYSRIPLGVHFRMDCDEGVRMGELAAQRVLELPWK